MFSNHKWASLGADSKLKVFISFNFLQFYEEALRYFKGKEDNEGRMKQIGKIMHGLTSTYVKNQIVMEFGKIAERGTHQELMSKNGVYAQLIDSK